MLKIKHKFDIFIVFSPTLSNALANDFYAEFIPGELMYTEYTPEKIDRLLEIQEAYINSGRDYKKAVIIFDDCIGSREKNDETLRKIMMMGRNKDITIIFIAQDITLTGTTWRNNSDYIFFSAEPSLKRKEIYVREFISKFKQQKNKSKEQMMAEYDDLTENHNFLVCNQYDGKIQVANANTV